MAEHLVVHHDGVMEHTATPTINTPLVRDPNSVLGGVLAGLARQQGWDVSLVRLTYVAFFLMTFGTAIFMYLLAWVIVPEANDVYDTPRVNTSI